MPGPETETPFPHWDGFAGAGKSHLYMAWHIVVAFQCMREVGIAFWNEAVEPCFEVAPGARISIFHDNQAATGMLAEDNHDTGGDAGSAGGGGDCIRDFVSSFAACAELKRFVMNGHGEVAGE